MKLTAIGLATALVLSSATAFAFEVGGAGGRAGADGGRVSYGILDSWVPTGDAWSPIGNPADCGGTVCAQKSRSPLTAPGPRHKRAKAHTRSSDDPVEGRGGESI
jgi:hypothetical protein